MLSVVNGLLTAGDLTPADIGVITPYSGQVRLLTDLFEQAGGRDEDFIGNAAWRARLNLLGRAVGVEDDTVEKCRGRRAATAQRLTRP